jgi:hypothetical protein
MDYLAFLDLYHDRVRAFHVKDAEFHRAGAPAFMAAIRTGSTARAASARSATGKSISAQIFSKMAQYDYPGWAVMEWECCLKHPEAGAAEGAKFIRDHIIRVTDRAFDDFAGGADTDTREAVTPDRTRHRSLGMPQRFQPRASGNHLLSAWPPPAAVPTACLLRCDRIARSSKARAPSNQRLASHRPRFRAHSDRRRIRYSRRAKHIHQQCVRTHRRVQFPPAPGRI